MYLPRESESLPFVVRLAQSEAERAEAAALRMQAYSRHEYAAGSAQHVGCVSDEDRRALLLIAREKQSGQLIGTLRVSSSRRGPTPVPAQMPRGGSANATFTYLDRFAILAHPHADILVLALVKAQWFLAYHESVDWIIAAALAPLARRYRRLGMGSLGADNDGRFHIPELHHEPYYACGGELTTMPARVIHGAPALVPFFTNKEHPDICVPRPTAMDEHVRAALQAYAQATDAKSVP